MAGREAGLNHLQTQLMSLLVYSAAAQIVASQMMLEHSSSLVIIMTVIAMNIHHLAYGLSLAKQFELNRLKTILAAFPLTDFAFGVTISQTENVELEFLLGVELSVFLAWNIYTSLAILFGSIFYSIIGLHLDFIVPLTFFVLLVAAIKSHHDIAVAIVSFLIAAMGRLFGLGNMTVILVCILGPLFGIGLINFRSSKGLQ